MTGADAAADRDHASRWTVWATVPLLVVPLALGAFAVGSLGDTISQRIATNLFINLVLVLGLQTYMGNSGILSFAHIGFMGIGAYAAAILSMTPQAKALGLPDLYPFLKELQLPFPAALVLGGVLAAAIAAVVGLPLMRLSDAAAVITSFALLVVIHTVLVHWSDLTNGPRTLFGVTRHTFLATATAWGGGFVALAYWFKESRVGLMLRASRDDPVAAASIGVDIVMARWAAFALSAFMAGIGGGLWAHFITSFSPAAFYLKETFVILAMLVIGGPLTVTGAVAGTIVVTIAFEGLRSIENALTLSGALSEPVVGLTEILLSIVMVATLILRPAGLMGRWEARWPRRTR